MGKLTGKHLVVISVGVLILIVAGIYLWKSVGDSYAYKKHVKMGQTYLGQGQWVPAITEFAKAARLRPENFDPHYGAGAAFLKLRHVDKAAVALENAVRINPESVEAHYSLGIAYQRLRKNDLAMREYEKVLRLNPQSFQVYNSIGALYYEAKKYDEAITMYKKAFEIKPDYFVAYFNIGSAYEAMGKKQDAIKTYKEAIEFVKQTAGDVRIKEEAEKRIARLNGKKVSSKKK